MSRTERALRAVYDVRFLLVVVIITTMISILIPIRQSRLTGQAVQKTVDQTRQTQLDNRDTNERIKDCVDPEGECYQNGQKRSANLLKQLQDYTVLANACSVVVLQSGATVADAEAQIRKCISDRLRKGPQ